MQEIIIGVKVDAKNAEAALEAIKSAAEGVGGTIENQTKKIEDQAKATEIGLKKQESNIKLLGGAINILGGAVETTVGLLGTIGIKEESLKGFQEGAASAIALADGTKRVFEGVKELNEGYNLAKDLLAKNGVATKALTVIQGIYNAVMNANPIFRLVTILAAVTAGIYLLTKALTDDTKAVQANNEALAKQKGALADAAQFQLEYAKAAGKSAEEVRKAEITRTNAAIDAARAELKAAKTAEDREKAAENLKKLKQQRILEEASFEKTQRDEAAKAADEAQKKAKENADKNKKLREDEIEESRQRRLRIEEDEDKIREAQRQRLEKQKQDAVEANRFLLTLEEEADAEAFQAGLDALNKQKALGQLRLELQKNEANTETEFLAVRKAEVNAYYNEKLAQAQGDAKLIAQIEKQRNAALEAEDKASNQRRLKAAKDIALAGADAAAGLFGALADAQDVETKEGFERNKKFKIAEVVTTSAQAAFQAVASSIGQLGPIAGPIVGAALAAGIAIKAATSIRDIQAATFESSSPKSGGSPISGGNGGGQAPPISTSFGQGGFLAPGGVVSQSGAQDRPVRAYVVTGDVTDGQQAEAQINRRRTLSGG